MLLGDFWFLLGHDHHSPRSLLFLPNLHSEFERLLSAQLHFFQHAGYADVEGLAEHEYVRMPPVGEIFVGYLSQGETYSLKAPALPSRPLQTTSKFKGRAYVAAHHGCITRLPGRPSESSR